MNIVKSNIVGIDLKIKEFQDFLYPKIKTLWNLNDDNFNMYGRAYRNQTKDGYIPEAHIGNGEYNDVFPNDTLNASAFFGVKENSVMSTTIIDASVTDVFLIFMVDLSKIKPGDERNDEQSHVDIQKLCSSRHFGFQMVGLTTGLDSVFSEYSGWRKQEGIKYRDMHPLHCFRINFKLNYHILTNK